MSLIGIFSFNGWALCFGSSTRVACAATLDIRLLVPLLGSFICQKYLSLGLATVCESSVANPCRLYLPEMMTTVFGV